jgi:hypothetical protein
MIDESVGVNWPLRLSPSGKYLIDQTGAPFLIIADAGWELTTQIADGQALAYLDDRQARGFNTVEIRVIGHGFQTNAPNDYYNNAPFSNGHSDWSVKGETYWARMDMILKAAKTRNMAVLVFPAYLGWQCGYQGWCADMISQTTGAMTDYGKWIGNRYKDYGNIIWMTGGDVDCVSYANACARNNAVMDGIKSVDADAMFSAEPYMEQIAGLDSYTKVDILGIYTYASPQSKVKTAFDSGRPFIFQEGAYENEHGSSIVTQDAQALITYLGGGMGHVFGSCPLWSFGTQMGYCDSGASPYFNSWTSNLASPGSVSQGNIGKLMRSRRWWSFVPDYSNVVVTSPKGSEFNYHATARDPNGETIMVWCPNTDVVTVNMTKIGGTQTKAWWWNPNDNTSALIGTYNTTGTRNFTPGSARKVLVLDNTASNLAAPGTTSYLGDKVPPARPTNLRKISQ